MGLGELASKRSCGGGGAAGLLRVALAVATAAIAVPVVRAETPPDRDGDSAIEEIVVTSPRVEETGHGFPGAVGVVTKHQIQLGQQQLTLGESLARIPGVFTQNEYNFAQDLRISIRGFGARASFGIRGIKLLVDGIPATLPDGQGQVDTLDLASAARIEVVRGPAASLYGGAAGGIISIVTEDGPEIPFVQARFSFGSYGFRSYQAKGGGRAGPVAYLASLSRQVLDGYRDHSRMENVLLNSKLRWAIDESSDLMAVVSAVHAPIADDPGALTAAQVLEDPRQARESHLQVDAGEKVDQASAGLVYRRRFGAEHETTASSYFVWRDFERDWYRGPDNLSDYGSRALLDDLGRFFAGGGVQHIWEAEWSGIGNRLVAGIDAEAQWDDRSRHENPYGELGQAELDQEERVTGIGVFIQDEFRPLQGFEVTLGFRYDWIQFELDDHLVGLIDGQPDDSGRLSFDELSPMLGLGWSQSPALNLYAKFSTSFETPTTRELANPSGGGGFNRELKPQRARNYEVGVKGLLPGRLRYELAAFHITLRDELIPFDNDAGTFYVNAGRSSRTGLEVALEIELLEGLTQSLAYTYSDFEFDRFRSYDASGSDRVLDGNRIPGVPEHHLHAELAYHHRLGFFGRWDLRYVGDIFADNENTVSSDAHVISNLRLGYRGCFGAWEVSPFVGINNLFDSEYIANLRLNALGGRWFEPAPRLNAYGGLSIGYSFGGAGGCN
jgi:iron complex outermembrane receptor protein